MVIIEDEIDLPDYFRREAVEPVIDETGHILRIYKSSHRSGSGAGSHIILNTRGLTSIVVGYYFSGLSEKARRKTRGGQFWRHYIKETRVEWIRIPDETKLEIRSAWEAERASLPWIKSPGKLSTERHKPNRHKRMETDETGAIIGYKYLIWIPKDKVFRSMWNINPDKILGNKRKVFSYWLDNFLEADEIPLEENSNGIYAAKTFDSPILVKYSHILDINLRLVRLLLSGTVLEPFEGMGYRAERADILQVFDDRSRSWVAVEEFIQNEYRREEVQSTQNTEADQGR